MDLKKNENCQNNFFVLLAVYLISIHPLYSMIIYIGSIAGVSISGWITYFYLFAIVATILLTIKYNLRVKDLIFLIGIYVFYGIQYFLANSAAKIYFSDEDVIVMLLVYAPVSVLAVTRVNDWKEMINNKFIVIYSDILITVLFFSKFSGLNTTNYMTFSYNLLPFWCLVFLAAVVNKDKLQWIFVFIGIIEGLIFGSRGALLWFVLFILVVLVFGKFPNHTISNKIVILVTFGVFGVFFLTIILPVIINSSFANESYFIARILLGSVTADSGRSNITQLSRNELYSMNIFEFNSIFYDRTVLPNNIYAHSVIYESLLAFGWIFGVLFLAILFGLIIRTYIHQDSIGRIFCLYFIFAFFLRYFVSGSIYDEGIFLVFLCAILSLNDNKYKKSIKSNILF